MKIYHYIIAALAIIAAISLAVLAVSNTYTADDIRSFLGRDAHIKNTETKKDSLVYIKVYDTTTVLVPKERIRTVVRNQIDTVYVTNAFSKMADTVIAGTYISFEYCFPEDSLLWKVVPKPDSIVYITEYKVETVQIPVEKEKSPPWYEDVIKVFIGVLVGYGGNEAVK